MGKEGKSSESQVATKAYERAWEVLGGESGTAVTLDQVRDLYAASQRVSLIGSRGSSRYTPSLAPYHRPSLQPKSETSGEVTTNPALADLVSWVQRKHQSFSAQSERQPRYGGMSDSAIDRLSEARRRVSALGKALVLLYAKYPELKPEEPRRDEFDSDSRYVFLIRG